MKPAGGIVDAHVHYWDPALFPYGWLAGLPALNRPFLPEDYALASSSCGVSKMVFVESACDPAHSLAEVDWVSSLALREPKLRAIVAHAPLELGSDVAAHLSRLAERPLVRGVRRDLQREEEGYCLQPGFVEAVRMLGDHGFTMDLCIRQEHLAAVAELASMVPGVPFILDHFGKPPVKQGEVEPWRSRLANLALLPNVSCKVSGLSTEADWECWRSSDLAPYFGAALESFGPDRLLFAGDWPVCTLATDFVRWVDTVVEFMPNMSADDSAKIFRTNAERIYRL